MVHSDNQGLVLPPKVALQQVVIVPVLKTGADLEGIKGMATKLWEGLKAAGVRVELDDREKYTPGQKYNHWELRGVPLRIEIGTNEFKNQTLRCCKRHSGEKTDTPVDGF